VLTQLIKLVNGEQAETSVLSQHLAWCSAAVWEAAVVTCYMSWKTSFVCLASINLIFVVPYILVTCMFDSSPTRCTLYSLFLS
jgi:hypothetical protein